VVSPQIVHKSEAKGIALDLEDAESIRRADSRIRSHVAQALPEAEIRGLLCRPMIPRGHEVILGAKRDPSFGPTLMFGMGGIYVELFRDVTFGLAPVARSTAMRMMQNIKAYQVLEGARGGARADIEGIAESLVRLGRLVADFEQILELDINPLIAGPADRGNAVADARIRLSQ
jgi:hypothetical protein